MHQQNSTKTEDGNLCQPCPALLRIAGVEVSYPETFGSSGMVWLLNERMESVVSFLALNRADARNLIHGLREAAAQLERHYDRYKDDGDQPASIEVFAGGEHERLRADETVYAADRWARVAR